MKLTAVEARGLLIPYAPKIIHSSNRPALNMREQDV